MLQYTILSLRKNKTYKNVKLTFNSISKSKFLVVIFIIYLFLMPTRTPFKRNNAYSATKTLCFHIHHKITFIVVYFDS